MSTHAPGEVVLQWVAHVFNQGVTVVEWMAFWSAVTLPLTYMPMLLAIKYTYLSSNVIIGIVAVNAVALLLGHQHRPYRYRADRARRRDDR